MNITGSVVSWFVVNDYISELVIRKTRHKKPMEICIKCFGKLSDKVQAGGFQTKDYLDIKFYLKSESYKGKYYSNIIAERIEIKRRKGIKCVGAGDAYMLNHAIENFNESVEKQTLR